MGLLLESQIRAEINKAFAGQLLTGTLRRVTTNTVDEFGDPATTSAATYTFEGIREDFSAFFRQQHGIPETDVGVLIIGGSISVEPQKGDQVKVRDSWYEIRRIIEIDPANAAYRMAAFAIEAPV